MNEPTPSSEIVDPGESFVRHYPFLDMLQVVPGPAGEGKATFDITVADRHLRSLGILHGGVTASLLDTAMGRAAGTIAPDGHFVVTIQLNVNFIRPAWKGETLTASGEVRHAGKQTAVTFGEVRNSSGTLIGSGTATFMFIPRPKDGADLKQTDDANSSDDEVAS